MAILAIATKRVKHVRSASTKLSVGRADSSVDHICGDARAGPVERVDCIQRTIALVDAVHVGIEIASSPYPHINADGALVTISDFGNNNGLVIGAEVPDWRDTDLLCWPVELWINDARIGAAIAADMLDGPFGAVAFLAGHLAARDKPLVVGQWVSTGAVTGVHPVAVGDRVEARFDGSYRLACTIKAQG